MENSIIIYKILKAISAAMDIEEFDEDRISPESLKTTQLRRDRLLIELQADGYIKGLRIKKFAGSEGIILRPVKPIITIKGIEYLENNCVMKKAIICAYCL